MDSSTLSFFANIRLNSAGTWIDHQLSPLCHEILATSAWPGETSGCPLLDVGNYLLRVLSVLATLAESLVDGEVISSHIDGRISELAAEDDLHTANALDDKHAALREIKSLFSKTLKDSEQVWSFTLSAPTTTSNQFTATPEDHGYSFPPELDHNISSRTIYDGSPPLEVPTMSNISHSAITSYDYDSTVDQSVSPRQPIQSSSAWHGGSQLSPGSTEGPIEDIPSLEQLKARGKGHYTCPHGTACEKGGVQPDGSLTVYKWNSAIRSHLQLHERMYRCDLPGCTNKKGFARIDQLERHKATTRHR